MFFSSHSNFSTFAEGSHSERKITFFWQCSEGGRGLVPQSKSYAELFPFITTILSRIIWTVVYIGSQICFIGPQICLLRTTCGRAIRPPCRAKEPPPAEVSSCLDTDFTPDIRRLQLLVILLHNKVDLLHHKSNFVVQINRFPTKITGWSLINEAWSLINKR